LPKGAASSAPTFALADVVRAFKSTSTLAVNRSLGRAGPLWQRNYYEHVIRDVRELEASRDYVIHNPETVL